MTDLRALAEAATQPYPLPIEERREWKRTTT